MKKQMHELCLQSFLLGVQYVMTNLSKMGIELIDRDKVMATATKWYNSNGRVKVK